MNKPAELRHKHVKVNRSVLVSRCEVQEHEVFYLLKRLDCVSSLNVSICCSCLWICGPAVSFLQTSLYQTSLNQMSDSHERRESVDQHGQYLKMCFYDKVEPGPRFKRNERETSCVIQRLIRFQRLSLKLSLLELKVRVELLCSRAAPDLILCCCSCSCSSTSASNCSPSLSKPLQPHNTRNAQPFKPPSLQRSPQAKRRDGNVSHVGPQHKRS